MLSQESPTLTAHRPSFPTCLFHPRRMHLLCHLDSPSAANLPYLGLQEQTGPEVSGLYGSYRVPSRSSLLPLRTLSPGGVAHRPTSLTQSSTARPQQPTGKTDTGFPKPVQQSQDDLTVMISEQGLHAQASSAFPNNKDSSTRIQHRLPVQGMRTRVFLEPDTDSTAPNRGVHGFFRTNTGFLSPYQNYTRNSYRLARTDHAQDSRVEWMREPPSRLTSSVLFACIRVDTCHPWNCMRSIRMPPFYTLFPLPGT
jgi:hypothetical protein